MSRAVIRPLEPADLLSVAELFDATLGPGFWSLEVDATNYSRVAIVDGSLAGAASAVLTDRLDEAPDLQKPVGLIRLVAVAETARRQGIATSLVRFLAQDCSDAGASALAAFAWVRGDSGICALSGVLTSLGFERQRRLESFYAGEGDAPCPACRCSPCVCAADLYTRAALTEGKNASPRT